MPCPAATSCSQCSLLHLESVCPFGTYPKRLVYLDLNLTSVFFLEIHTYTLRCPIATLAVLCLSMGGGGPDATDNEMKGSRLRFLTTRQFEPGSASLITCSVGQLAFTRHNLTTTNQPQQLADKLTS